MSESCIWRVAMAMAGVVLLGAGAPAASAQPQRALGLDISDWQNLTNSAPQPNVLTQEMWNNFRTNDNRVFVNLRASRGGTTGTYDEYAKTGTGSQRYDDFAYIFNMNCATLAGMFAGSYHFARPEVAGNTGTDEADHFFQMAGPWMRPGYMLPVLDLESGSGADTLAQFCIDFSNQLYTRTGIRPGIYAGSGICGTLQGATQANRDLLARPAPNLPTNASPSVVSPCIPMLWNPRYDSSNVQGGNPSDSASGFYGPWDDYGVAQPWDFWQYSSGGGIEGFTSLDMDVSHGDIEYVKNFLVPAVWVNNVNGFWAGLANWNCGQPVTAPVRGDGQPAVLATGPLPAQRLPGQATGDVTSGVYDTVILERPNANITVTFSFGSYNIRKLYMREALNISAGSLTINYDPTYRPDDTPTVLHGGPVSAQFSGPVTLSGTGTLNVNTLQVDTNCAFTLNGGTLAFRAINLMPGTTPATIAVGGDVNYGAYPGTTATIANGAGSGSSGQMDLGGGTRVFTVAGGVDLFLEVPINNGGLTKSGLGTLRLDGANTYGGGTTVSAGQLLVNNTSGSGTGTGTVTVNGGTLGGNGTIGGVVTVNSGGTVAPGTPSVLGTLTLNSVPTLNGTAFARVARNAGGLADKLVLTSGTLIYSGTLVVSNSGAPLIGGEVFTLFSAGAYAGAFGAINLPTLNGGLNWYLDNLAVNGTISVNRQPVVNGLTLTATPGQVLQIPKAALLGSDADGDPLSLVAFDPVTADGITLTSDGSYIYYLNNENVSDQFSYTINDGRGGVVTSQVQIAQFIPTPPSIISGLDSITVIASQNATFSVTATGSPPLSYFWQHNGTPIAGATESKYTLVNAQLSDSGSQFSCLVTNVYGSVQSSNAVLTVSPPPPCAALSAGLVSWWPAENSTADLTGGNTGTVAGYGSFGYAQGVVGQAFVFDGMHRDRVDVGNPPSLQLQDFTIEAWIKRSSSADISLDDENQDGAIAGQGGIVFGYGRYGYGFGLLDNGQLLLSKIDADGIYSTAVVADTSWHHVAVTKSGSTAVFYIDGVPASGAIPYTTTYTFSTSAAIGSRGDGWGGTFWGMVDEPSVYSRGLAGAEIQAIYAAGLSGKCATPTAPVIIVQPGDQTAPAGNNAAFAVIAAGTAPLGYQWLHNGTNVPSATASSLALANIQPVDAGSYSVIASNSMGTTLSSNAVLTVLTFPPTILSQPTNQTVNAGGTATFSVTASGTLPLSYFWRRNGAPIAGATTSTFSFNNALLSDSGSLFSCLVSNAYGTALSSSALLTVLQTPVVLLAADFESGLQGFTIDNTFGRGNGLWHLSTGRGSNAGHSPTHSLYYGLSEGANGGGNYNPNGVANAGVVVSPSITLPSGVAIYLSFSYLMNVENLSTYDLTYVELSANNGASYSTVASKGSGLTYYTSGVWVSNRFDLSAAAGMTIKLRFRFDTVDGILNDTEGWYLDDIRIRVNHPPTASNVSAATKQNQSLGISADKLLLSTSDLDGDPLTLTVSATSTNNGSVILSGGLVTYTPVANFTGADRFTYTVNDGQGGTASGYVLVQVRPANQVSGNMFVPTPIPGGWLINFAGIPGRTYTLQRAELLSGPWSSLSSITVGPTGIAAYTDTNAPPTNALYRTTYP